MIRITVNRSQETNQKFISPIDLWGVEHGKIYQQYFKGKPQKQYLIGAGYQENPISLWYDDEGHRWRLSSESKQELKDYVREVVYLELDKATLDIHLGIE